MRATFLLCCGSLALGAIGSIAACATSEAVSEVAPLPDSGGSSALPEDNGAEDSGSAEGATDSGAEGDGPECSAAGWCRTTLPDEDLTLKDISAVGDAAFAIADSPTLGIKVLEWRNADSTWRYIHDNTQHMVDLGTYPGRIWAPSEDEVYYGVGAGYLYHGKRPSPPATTWSWTRQRLGDESDAAVVGPQDAYPAYPSTDPGLHLNYPTLGIWGTSADDVYAWFVNTLYHRTSIGGAEPKWVPEYVADDATASEHMYFFAAAGAGPDEVWFSGARATSSVGCAVLVRKTGGTYQKVADGTPNSHSCAVRDGHLQIAGDPGFPGWLTDIHMPSANQIVGLMDTGLVRVSITGDGYSASVVPINTQATGWPFVSLWAEPGSIWMSGSGVLYRIGDDVWDGGSSAQISTLAINGAPFEERLYRIRGTSTTNLWAIGVRNAFHKTTP